MGPDHAAIALISTLSTAVNGLVHLGLAVVFITIAATTVRRDRRDVMSWFLVYGIGLALLAVLGPLAYWGAGIASTLARDVASIVLMNHAVGLTLTVLHAFNAGVLATGIIKLARLPAAADEPAHAPR